MSLCVILITRFVSGILAHNKVATLFVQREQARMLALSGIQVAISQLSPEIDEKEKANQDKVLQKNYGAFLEYANKWQNYKLSESHEGVDGTIALYIALETGKLNINSLYNQKEKKFVITPGAKKLLIAVAERLQALVKNKNLFDAFENFLRKQDKPLDDITQVIAIEDFNLPLFITKSDKPTIALADIFSVDIPSTAPLQPLALSQSLSQIFGFKVSTDNEQNNKRVQEIVKKLKSTMNWQQDWEATGAQLLGKPYIEIATELKNIFEQKLEAKIFSVVSEATSGNVTQKLYAIIEKVTDKDKNEHFLIRRIYWI